MPTYPIWPHRLVFNFAYGRWCTFFVLFASIFFLFYLVDAFSSIQDEAIPLFFCFTIPYIIPASHYVSAQTLAAFDGMKPALDLDETELAAIHDSLSGVSAKSQLQMLVIGILAGLGHDYLLLTSEFGMIEAVQALDGRNIMFLVITIFIWVLLVAVISFLRNGVRVFARLAKDHVRIDLLNDASLRAFSRVAVYSTLILMGALAGFPLLMLGTETNYVTVIPGFLTIFISMLFIFLVPLIPVRKRIKNSKAHELESIQNRINQLTQDEHNLAANTETLSQLQPLLDYRREIQQVAEWPFDSPALVRLLFYLFIPPLTWVGAALIERLVDTVSF
jgi:hypothetical protein